MGKKKNYQKGIARTSSNLSKIIIGVVAFLLVIIIVSAISSGTKNYDEFAECLANRGFVMAGTSWCVHCQNQKEMFRGSFETIFVENKGYVDCDQQRTKCDELGVQAYPTWITPEGTQLRGVIQFKELSQLSGCPLP